MEVLARLKKKKKTHSVGWKGLPLIKSFIKLYKSDEKDQGVVNKPSLYSLNQWIIGPGTS